MTRDNGPKASITFTELQVADILLRHLQRTGRVPPGAPAHVRTTWSGAARTITVTWPDEGPEPEKGIRLRLVKG